MYSRSFRPSQKRTEGDIPVQYFGDSFSPNVFSSMYSSDIESKPDQQNTGYEKGEEKSNEPVLDNKTNAPTKAARSFDIEDLLLIGMVLLFTTDINNKEDLIVPIVLAAILLF
ncbi:MAG: hypothetical protein E7656_00575 [Ruminococcaceae bacterium]|nr:hypothetical protein [Oscillospiraceae bacterium]